MRKSRFSLFLCVCIIRTKSPRTPHLIIINTAEVAFLSLLSCPKIMTSLSNSIINWPERFHSKNAVRSLFFSMVQLSFSYSVLFSLSVEMMGTDEMRDRDRERDRSRRHMLVVCFMD